jgi:8-oxo-dGTP pyrophosphatase MutT (NUDIX family)
MRVGFGIRDPRLLELLAISKPAATGETVWMGGRLPLTVTAYTEPAELPDEIITSVRCIVDVRGKIVLCENEAGFHIWPGGGRKPGETFADTALREVHEETGWLIDVSTIRTVGWLHHAHVKPAAEDHPYPNPDFLHPVLHAVARERDGGEANEWTDTEGYEVASRLVTIEEAHKLLSPQESYEIHKVFLDLL